MSRRYTEEKQEKDVRRSRRLQPTTSANEGEEKTTNTKKCSVHVQIPLLLNIKADGEDVKYNLKAIIKHYGNGQKGHYIAQVKVENTTWISFDDAKVQNVKENDVLKKSKGFLASHVFYVKAE